MLADHQGSIRQIVDNTGSLLNQITYDSYGNITNQTNPSVTFRFGYTGREWDGETGQYYYRARYYDARVGRFLSTDPIGFTAGDANLYRYVGNSPTNWVDPYGLYQSKERCKEIRSRIIANAIELSQYLRRYDADLDAQGGFTIRDKSTGIPTGKTTIPGGHYQTIRERQLALKRDITIYLRHCIKDNDDQNPNLPKFVDEVVNRKVTPPPVPKPAENPVSMPQIPAPNPEILLLPIVGILAIFGIDMKLSTSR
jgi:RHS repeat-associated protein